MKKKRTKEHKKLKIEDFIASSSDEDEEENKRKKTKNMVIKECLEEEKEM